VRVDDVQVPSSPAAVAAREVAAEYCSPALFNHSERSYYFAVGFASVLALDFDAELLYVSALLHDLGLTSAFDNHRMAFETAGGHAAWVLTAGAGWPTARRRRAREVIERHMWPSVDPAFDPEGHLLEIATALDISGSRPDVLPRNFLNEVLARHPRLGLGAEFTASLTDQAERKSDTPAARLVAGGLAEKLRGHPLEG
jgi:HD domain